MTTASPSPFPLLVQQYFCQRLIAQRNASQRTVSSYRDTFRLLLGFAENRLHKIPTALTLSDLDAPFILEFLDHLEHGRGNTPRTRNARLTTIRSFMKYASHEDPTALPVIQRVLAIPRKRLDRPLVGFLSREQIDAVLAAPDRSTWSGQRDHVLLATMYNTGARVSEVTAMRRMDLALDRSAAARLHGKGRKERAVPLWRTTADALRNWLSGLPDQPDHPVFPNARGTRMSRSGVEDRLDAAVRAAAQKCPSLRGRSVSPHMLRHSTAMHLLQSGVDITVIALWLGHESPATTHLYVEADLQMKERALAMVPAADVKTGRYRPGDRLLAFLQAL